MLDEHWMTSKFHNKSTLWSHQVANKHFIGLYSSRCWYWMMKHPQHLGQKSQSRTKKATNQHVEKRVLAAWAHLNLFIINYILFGAWLCDTINHTLVGACLSVIWSKVAGSSQLKTTGNTTARGEHVQLFICPTAVNCCKRRRGKKKMMRDAFKCLPW